MHIITEHNNGVSPKDLRGLHCIITFICLADVLTLGNMRQLYCDTDYSCFQGYGVFQGGREFV